jgi:hypothetical protein
MRSSLSPPRYSLFVAALPGMVCGTRAVAMLPRGILLDRDHFNMFPLLRGLEQARRSALAHHVARIAPMGARVLINGTRYKSVHGVAFLRRNHHPEPSGSRRATPPISTSTGTFPCASAITPCWNNQPWRRDSNKMASDKPGAVQRGCKATAKLGSGKPSFDPRRAP